MGNICEERGRWVEGATKSICLFVSYSRMQGLRVQVRSCGRFLDWGSWEILLNEADEW